MGTIVNENYTNPHIKPASVVESKKPVSIHTSNAVNTSAPEEDKKLQRQNELLGAAQCFTPRLSLKQAEKLITDATGFSADKLYNEVDDKTFTLISSKTLPSLLEIIENRAKKGGKSIDEIIDKVAAKFYASIKDGNNLEEATNYYCEFGQHNILEMIKFKHPELKNCKSLSEVPKDVLKEFLEGMIEKSQKLAKENNGIGFGEKINMLKTLLNGLSDDDKHVLWEVMKEIATSEEKVQLLATVINKTENAKKLQAFLRQFTPETIQALGLDKQDVAKAYHLLSHNLDEEGVKQLQELQFKFVEQVNTKIRELKSKKPEEYTEEDKKTLEALEFVKQSFAGAITGYQGNKNLSADARKVYSTNVLDKSKEYDIYDDVLTNIVELTHDTTGIVNFSEEDLENFNSQMNELTNGDYNQAIETYNASTNGNSNESSGNVETDYGYSMPAATDIDVLRESINNKKEELKESDEPNKFEIEKTTKKSVSTLSEAKQISGSFVKVIEDFKNYNDKILEEAAKTVARFGRATQVYYANLCSNMKFTNAIGNNNNGWSIEQINHLNLAFAQRKELTEKAEKKEAHEA